MLNLKWIVGDITKDRVDVIVNAANWTILGGGGVDGAIHKAAGPGLLRECTSLREGAEYEEGLKTGEMVATYAYGLPANFVFHTVGPIYDARDFAVQREQLKSCYVKCIQRALDWNQRSIAFPAISTGAYSFPKKSAAKAVRKALDEFKGQIRDLEVRFYFSSREDLDIHFAEVQ